MIDVRARTTEFVWDVVVVGSGPAGSAAALSALKHDPLASVLLIDQADFPRDKCCGDAVLNRGVAELETHGIPRSSLLAGYRPERTMRLVSTDRMALVGELPEPMTVLPRRVFDARLLSAVRDLGAAWRRHRVRKLSDRGSHVDIDGRIRARVVIGADGAESVVRRAISAVRPTQMAVALRGYDSREAEHTPVMVFDERGGLSYAWRFPASTGPANVGYGRLVQPAEKASRSELLDSLTRFLPEVDPDPDSLHAHRIPLATSGQPAARGRMLLAGDAAALVNPLSGEGIYYAIVSGLIAGQVAVTGHDVARRHRHALRNRFGVHHAHVGALAAAVRFPAVLDAGLRGATNDARAFADLAEIGLADGRITARLAMTLLRQLVTDRFSPRN